MSTRTACTPSLPPPFHCIPICRSIPTLDSSVPGKLLSPVYHDGFASRFASKVSPFLFWRAVYRCSSGFVFLCSSPAPPRYELLGRKQGEADLGEGRAGVVRKCIERQAPSQGGEGGDGDKELLVRACKCISKKQQSEEETDRELAIMRKLIGNAG